MSQKHSIIVQYRIAGHGSTDDLHRRHHLEDLLDHALHETRNGECDGGDIGSGAANIYLENIADLERAVETVRETLRRHRALDGAVIAACSLDESKDSEAETELRVMWPKHHADEFRLFYEA